MNMVIDAGNTRTKIGIFEGEVLQATHVFDEPDVARAFLGSVQVTHLLVSTVTDAGQELAQHARVAGRRFLLTPSLPLPIENRYATPHTLGADRLAAACGAWHLFPGKSTLVIDCGTCINYEYVESRGVYLGGAISPGATMRFSAMHQNTHQLPLGTPVSEAVFTGRTTMECLESGVMNGILEEIRGIIRRYQEADPGIRVILTGGDAHFFEKPLKPHIFVAPELILTGLHSILRHNVHS
jgi:type III pantothenate kinase